MSEAETPAAPATPGRPEPGAPVPRDAIDGDLVRLRRPRPQIGAVTALAIVILCGYLAMRLDDDRRFAGEPGEPRTVTVEQVASGAVAPESHVAVVSRLEHAAAVRASQSKGVPGHRVVPVVGSGDLLWVALFGDARDAPPALDGRYAGRLKRLSDVPFADAVHSALQKSRPRFVTGDELRRARTASADGGTLPTVAGSKLTAAADTEVEIEVADPSAASLVASTNERFPDAAAWTAALVQAGVVPAGAAPTTSEPDVVVWQLRGPDAVADATRKLEAAGLWAARVEPVTARHRAAWRDLVPSETGLAFPGGASLPWSAIDVAALWVPRPVPANAMVLVVGETPDQYWMVLPIYGAFAVFGLLFGWALLRAVRRDILVPRAAR